MLSELALRSKAYWGYSDEFIESCRDELAVSPEAVDSAEYAYRVAVSDNDILGFHAVAEQGAGLFELEALFVDPPHIGRGVGHLLMDDAKSVVATRGGGRLLIQGDPNAERFYRAAGAEKVGERESGSIPGRFLPLFELTVAGED